MEYVMSFMAIGCPIWQRKNPKLTAGLMGLILNGTRGKAASPSTVLKKAGLSKKQKTFLSWVTITASVAWKEVKTAIKFIVPCAVVGQSARAVNCVVHVVSEDF
jgi:hypothetical protein